MSSYNVTQVTKGNITKLTVTFGSPASDDRIVVDAIAAIEALGPLGGPLCLISGLASLPVAFMLGHTVAHDFSAVGVYVPKLEKYVVVVSHESWPVGTLIDGTVAHPDE